MEVYIHKQTGKGWILIDVVDDQNGDFISPALRRMQRPFIEFENGAEGDVTRLLEEGVISPDQIDALAVHEESRKEEMFEDVIQHFRDMIEKHGKPYAERIAAERFSGDTAAYIIGKAAP
ncbi:MAG: hypothetical protein ACOWWM_19715 [Desulfobacterales bacterium]